MELAAGQHGVVSYPQLLACGLSPDAVKHRVRVRRLHRLHQGVYAVGAARLGRTGRFMAAVLACGEAAALSHTSAAALWGMMRIAEDQRVHVSVPCRSGRRRRAGLQVHRSSTLGAGHVTARLGIPVTTAERTIIDVADISSRRVTERAMDQATIDGLINDPRRLTGTRGRSGSRHVTAILAAQRLGSTVTDSALEEMMLALCRQHDLPMPELGALVNGYKVDFLWRQDRLVVETDGFRTHGTRLAFETDRARDQAHVAAGYRTMRFTYRQVAAEPATVALTISRALARR